MYHPLLRCERQHIPALLCGRYRPGKLPALRCLARSESMAISVHCVRITHNRSPVANTEVPCMTEVSGARGRELAVLHTTPSLFVSRSRNCARKIMDSRSEVRNRVSSEEVSRRKLEQTPANKLLLFQCSLAGMPLQIRASSSCISLAPGNLQNSASHWLPRIVQRANGNAPCERCGAESGHLVTAARDFSKGLERLERLLSGQL